MRKLILFISILLLLAFSDTKTYRLTAGEGAMLFKALSVAKRTIPYSDNVSAKDATMSIAAIDSIQKILLKQYRDTIK